MIFDEFFEHLGEAGQSIDVLHDGGSEGTILGTPSSQQAKGFLIREVCLLLAIAIRFRKQSVYGSLKLAIKLNAKVATSGVELLFTQLA